MNMLFRFSRQPRRRCGQTRLAKKGLVCLGRSEGRWHGARNNWLSVFGGPELVLSARAAPILPPQIPAPAAQAELDAARGAGGGAFSAGSVAGTRRRRVSPRCRQCLPARSGPDWQIRRHCWRRSRDAYAWSAAANMQRHLHDSNLVENKALLDIVRRRVEKFDDNAHSPASPQRERKRERCPQQRLRCEGRRGAIKPCLASFLRNLNVPAAICRRIRGCIQAIISPLLHATDAAGVRAHLETLAQYPDHWPCVSFSNHDVTRTVTRFG